MIRCTSSRTDTRHVHILTYTHVGATIHTHYSRTPSHITPPSDRVNRWITCDPHSLTFLPPPCAPAGPSVAFDAFVHAHLLQYTPHLRQRPHGLAVGAHQRDRIREQHGVSVAGGPTAWIGTQHTRQLADAQQWGRIEMGPDLRSLQRSHRRIVATAVISFGILIHEPRQ